MDRHGTVVINGGTNLDPLYVPCGLYKSDPGSDEVEVIADRRLASDPVFVSFKFGSTFKIASIVDGIAAFEADIKLFPGDLCGCCLDGFGAKLGAIWLYDGETIKQIVSWNTKPRDAPNFISALSVPDSDGAGFVAFWANASAYRHHHEGIYRYYRGELRKIADFETIIPGTDQKFASFIGNGPVSRPVSIRGDIVAFQGAPDLTLFNVGIYVWVAGELVKLIAPGDELGDQTVATRLPLAL